MPAPLGLIVVEIRHGGRVTISNPRKGWEIALGVGSAEDQSIRKAVERVVIAHFGEVDR